VICTTWVKSVRGSSWAHGRGKNTTNEHGRKSHKRVINVSHICGEGSLETLWPNMAHNDVRDVVVHAKFQHSSVSEFTRGNDCKKALTQWSAAALRWRMLLLQPVYCEQTHPWSWRATQQYISFVSWCRFYVGFSNGHCSTKLLRRGWSLPTSHRY